MAHFDLEQRQMDVVTAFLNGNLDEDIYMEQPDGCADGAKPDFVRKFLKAIYGLKQAHRRFHYIVNSFLLTGLAFKTICSAPCLYIKREINFDMIISLFVDDLLLASSDLNAMLWMKGELGELCMTVLVENVCAWLPIRVYCLTYDLDNILAAYKC